MSELLLFIGLFSPLIALGLWLRFHYPSKRRRKRGTR